MRAVPPVGEGGPAGVAPLHAAWCPGTRTRMATAKATKGSRAPGGCTRRAPGVHQVCIRCVPGKVLESAV